MRPGILPVQVDGVVRGSCLRCTKKSTACFVRSHDTPNARNQEHNDANDYADVRFYFAKLCDQIAEVTAQAVNESRDISRRGKLEIYTAALVSD